eukprot:7076657-Prymnesium_polylepis.1
MFCGRRGWRRGVGPANRGLRPGKESGSVRRALASGRLAHRRPPPARAAGIVRGPPYRCSRRPDAFRALLFSQTLTRPPSRRSGRFWSSTTAACWSPTRAAASRRSSAVRVPARVARSRTVKRLRFSAVGFGDAALLARSPPPARCVLRSGARRWASARVALRLSVLERLTVFVVLCMYGVQVRDQVLI